MKERGEKSAKIEEADQSNDDNNDDAVYLEFFLMVSKWNETQMNTTAINVCNIVSVCMWWYKNEKSILD